MDKPSALVDTRVIYCGDNLEQLKKLPDECVDLIYIDPPFNSNRNYEVFWGETKEKRAFEDRHESTKAYIDFMRPRCGELARVLKKTGSFYYHCDWHASHYVKVMLDQIFGENSFLNEIMWKRRRPTATQSRGASISAASTTRCCSIPAGANTSSSTNTGRMTRSTSKVSTSTLSRKPDAGIGSAIWQLPVGHRRRRAIPHYEFLGVTRYWRYAENMQKLYKHGRIIQTKPGAVPAYKRYLDEGARRPTWFCVG